MRQGMEIGKLITKRRGGFHETSAVLFSKAQLAFLSIHPMFLSVCTLLDIKLLAKCDFVRLYCDEYTPWHL